MLISTEDTEQRDGATHFRIHLREGIRCRCLCLTNLPRCKHGSPASTCINAPEKTLLVPKLEQNAALQAARLARTVEGALTRKVYRLYFWTESSTVRNWIRATTAKYSPRQVSNIPNSLRWRNTKTLTEQEE